MFENVDGQTNDGRTMDAGVTGILIAHLGAFGSGELKSSKICNCRLLQIISGALRVNYFMLYLDRKSYILQSDYNIYPKFQPLVTC